MGGFGGLTGIGSNQLSASSDADRHDSLKGLGPRSRRADEGVRPTLSLQTSVPSFHRLSCQHRTVYL